MLEGIKCDFQQFQQNCLAKVLQKLKSTYSLFFSYQDYVFVVLVSGSYGGVAKYFNEVVVIKENFVLL